MIHRNIRLTIKFFSYRLISLVEFYNYINLYITTFYTVIYGFAPHSFFGHHSKDPSVCDVCSVGLISSMRPYVPLSAVSTVHSQCFCIQQGH